MITTTALPPKPAQAKCTSCGLVGAASLFVTTHAFKGELRGRCKNRKACDVRQLRVRNKAKAKKSEGNE